jgi:hypothetical protein
VLINVSVTPCNLILNAFCLNPYFIVLEQIQSILIHTKEKGGRGAVFSLGRKRCVALNLCSSSTLFTDHFAGQAEESSAPMGSRLIWLSSWL